MIRSLKKGPFVAYQLLKKITKLNKDGKKEIIKTWSRSSVIIPEMIGHTISIYNGLRHIPVYISESLIGYKLGEFSPTRFPGEHKNKINDKKLKKR